MTRRSRVLSTIGATILGAALALACAGDAEPATCTDEYTADASGVIAEGENCATTRRFNHDNDGPGPNQSSIRLEATGEAVIVKIERVEGTGDVTVLAEYDIADRVTQYPPDDDPYIVTAIVTLRITVSGT